MPRRACHASGSGRPGFIELSISWEEAGFSALLESVNGVAAQPARLVATVINNVTPRIQAGLLFGDIGTPTSRFAVRLSFTTKRNDHDFPRNSKADGKPMAKAGRDIEIGVAAPIEPVRINIGVDEKVAEEL